MSDLSMGSTDIESAVERSMVQAQDCRECHVICERVVAPWRCLRERRTCMYAYSDGESTYVGCVHKVFLPELDLAAFGEERADGRRADPYGMVRVARRPRPQCPVSVERAYSFEALNQRCVNPGFLRDSFRVARNPETDDYDETVDADGHEF